MQNRHESKLDKLLLWRRATRFPLGGVWLSIFAFQGTAIQAQEFLFKIPEQPSFRLPRGVAIDSDGFIWVADSSHHQVVQFDPDTPGVETRIGALGGGDGQFDEPIGVAIDSSGTIYVADFRNHRI